MAASERIHQKKAKKNKAAKATISLLIILIKSNKKIYSKKREEKKNEKSGPSFQPYKLPFRFSTYTVISNFLRHKNGIVLIKLFFMSKKKIILVCEKIEKIWQKENKHRYYYLRKKILHRYLSILKKGFT